MARRPGSVPARGRGGPAGHQLEGSVKAYVTVWGYCLLGRGKVHRFPHGVQRGRMVYGPWGIRLPALELCGTCLQPQQWPPEAVELNRLQQEAMREEGTDGRDTAASL